MSALPVEATEPDPAATSLSDNETPKVESVEASAPSGEVEESNKTELKEANGSGEGTEGGNEQKSVKNGASKNQNSPQSRRQEHANKNRYTSNSKYDPSVLEATSDHKKIRAQVEFYFGDANLPTDKYMWEMTDGTTNRPVPISDICKFGRMKRFQPYSAVVAALRDSPFLLVSGSEGEEKVSRKVPFDPTAPRNKTEARSVYVKGFGDEERSSQFDIEAFFAPYGPTNAVRLRRSSDKLFKGSVFVEFADDVTAQKFLELDPKPLWKGKHELVIKSKKEYMDEKKEEIKDGKMEPGETWAPRGRGRGGSRGGRGNNRGKDRGDRERGGRENGRGRGGRDRGDRDPDDWKKRREDDRAAGFKDDKRKNDRGDRRGGSRGGRRGGREDREPRGDNSGGNGDEKTTEQSSDTKNEGSETALDKREDVPSTSQIDKKRGREDDHVEGENPAKKVDAKSD